VSELNATSNTIEEVKGAAPLDDLEKKQLQELG
jgi:hypothetical protein